MCRGLAPDRTRLDNRSVFVPVVDACVLVLLLLLVLLLAVRSSMSGHWDGCQCHMSWSWSTCGHGAVDGRLLAGPEVDSTSHWAAWDAENRGILIRYVVW